MVRMIVWSIVIYLIYKFIFELVIPVGKATSQVKDKMREMQQMQEEQAARARQQSAYQPTSTPPSSPKRDDDYIDFEEVKP